MTIEHLAKRSDIIDVSDLMNRCLGNMDFAARVLQLLAERGEEDLTVLEAAASSHDYEQLYHVSHRLKGAFANASASSMSGLANALCTAAESCDEAVALEKAQELRTHWNEFTSVLQGSSQERVAVQGA